MKISSDFFDKILLCFLLVLTVQVMSCSVGDDKAPAPTPDPPDQIMGLSEGQTDKVLNWIAPGDDGNTGTATLYLFRYLNTEQVETLLGVNSLDGIEFDIIQETVRDNFAEATQVPFFLSPSKAGSPESFPIPRLDINGQDNFYFSIITNDEVGNSSPVSNVVEVTTPLVGSAFQDQDEVSCLGVAAASAEVGGRDADDQDDIIDDLIIGDPCLGRVYIFFGGPNFARQSIDVDVDQADVTIIGDPSESFGASVSGIGNFGGKGGFQEIAIGAPEADNGAGKVYIIFGDEKFGEEDFEEIDLNLGEEADRIINGENPGDNFGFVIKERGSDNFYVGAPGALNETGKLYIFDGNDVDNEVMNATSAKDIVTGESEGDLLGFDVTNAGDIDDDSPLDYAVSAPGAAKVYVIFDTKNIDLSQSNLSDVLIIEGSVEDRFGESISGGFNVDGLVDDDQSGDNLFLDADLDEDADLLIGAPGTNNEKGSVFLYSGDDLKDAIKDGTSFSFVLRIDGLSDGDNFGASVEELSDINPIIDVRDRNTANVLDLDSTPADFAIGAPGSENGKVYVFFGEIGFSGNLTSADADITIEPTSIETLFGGDIFSLGDINDDAFVDFAIGSDNFLVVEY